MFRYIIIVVLPFPNTLLSFIKEKMKTKILRPSDYVQNEWSGGTTSQIFIYPDGASLSERDFYFRISSAGIETETSNFSEFEGYNRFFTPLNSGVELTSNGSAPKKINPLELFHFDGASETSAVGKCIDFNLIYKKSLKANLTVATYSKTEIVKYTPFPSSEFILIYCWSGAFEVCEQTIQPGETFLIQNCPVDVELLITKNSTLLISELSFKKD